MKREKMGNGRRYRMLAAAAVLTVALFCGCGGKVGEQELAYRQMGIDYMQEGSYADAILVFDRALAECSGRVGATEIDICYYKAAAQYASGDMDGALETYDTLIDYNKKDANTYYMRGCLRLQMGNADGAKGDFEAAVQYDAENYELYVCIYENLAAYGMGEDGEAYLNQAFSIEGNEAQNLVWRGRLYYLLGQYENATQELNAALKKDGADANLILGEVYEALGDTETAESYYQTYVESGEADAVVMNRIAVIAMGRGDYGEALSYVLQGLSMEQVPNRQELLRNEIVCLEYTGDFAGAWTVVQEYAAAYPEDLNAQREYVFLKNRQVNEE